MPTHAADEGRRAPTAPSTHVDLDAPAQRTTLAHQFLTRDMLMARPIRTAEAVLSGGGRIRVRALKQGEREKLDDEALEKNYKDDGSVTFKVNNRGFQAKALAMCMVNEDGTPYWPSVEEGQAALADLDDALFDEMFAPCDTLNILTAGARKALGKDFAPSPSSNS